MGKKVSEGKKMPDAVRRSIEAPNPATAERARLSELIGADIRRIREGAGRSQQSIAELFNWGRDAISKLETGKNDVYLYDYLKMVNSFRETVPDHPALFLYDYLFPKRKHRD